MWYLIVSIPDLCILTYFGTSVHHKKALGSVYDTGPYVKCQGHSKFVSIAPFSHLSFDFHSRGTDVHHNQSVYREYINQTYIDKVMVTGQGHIVNVSRNFVYRT